MSQPTNWDNLNFMQNYMLEIRRLLRQKLDGEPQPGFTISSEMTPTQRAIYDADPNQLIARILDLQVEFNQNVIDMLADLESTG